MEPIIIIGDSKILQFLYCLLRDEMPSGKAEAIMEKLTSKLEVSFSNPYTLLHAKDILKRLTPQTPTEPPLVADPESSAPTPKE
jgi:hypothetical protein